MRARANAGRARAALASLALAALAGCAIVPTADYQREQAKLPAERVELSAVPFFAQQDYQCGPAALATALQSAGIERTPQQLVEQVYLPERKGSLQLEMLGASRRAGAVPYVLQGEPDAMLREVAAGHPVVVLQDLGLIEPQWHYAVVVGYDLADKTLTLRSGTTPRLVMPIAVFDRSWARSGRWAFVALPPDRLPASAGEADYVKAVADFERVSPKLGPRAWKTALAAWPHNLFARLAAGNAAYRNGDLADALNQYRQATQDHPGAADAWNNLAQVLFERGEAAPAAQAARRAVQLGGPRPATYAQTLREIEAAGAQ